MNALILKSLVLVVSALLLAAGCGGGDDQGSATRSNPKLDACALLTAADASEVLGAPAAEAESYTKMDRVDEQMGSAISNCLYARDGSFETVSVFATYQRSENPASFDALRAESEASGGQMAQMTLELLDSSDPVNGLGDFAYWNDDASTLTVYARRHYVIAINADAGDSASARARATDAATRILDRL